jgi:NADP-dependent 3-hydroxy acid dehydrogenase YdfG
MTVVTGATGRTGRRVTEVLRAGGEKVLVIGRDMKKLNRSCSKAQKP